MHYILLDRSSQPKGEGGVRGDGYFYSKDPNDTSVKIYDIFIPPVYEVYRWYIVFAFSVRMFVCLSVCLSVNSPSKISQKLLDLGF